MPSFSVVTQSTRAWVSSESMTNAAYFAFIDNGENEVMGQLFLFFQRKILIWMTFVDWEDTVRLICSECNKLVFLLLVQIPWIESSECISFIHMATAKSVRACEVQMLWKSSLPATLHL